MTSKTLSASLLRHWIPRRKPDSHKGTYGHVLIVAGSRGMSGACALSAYGALRGGAGLVTAALPKSLQPVLAKRIRPEAMTLGLPETSKGGLSPAAAAVLLSFMRKRRVTSLVIGPGVSREPSAQAAVRALLSRLDENSGGLEGIVLDADGFLACSHKHFLRKLTLPLIVTPHPGEFAAFLGRPTAKVQARRMETAREFAKLYKVVCVLKGHRSLVSDGKAVWANPTGNPGMATGGSGDVLAGLIGACIAQTDGLLEAACAGVYLHGLAGDLAAKEKSQPGLVAGDIAEKIPQAWKRTLK